MAKHRITYITLANALPSTKQFSSERAAAHAWGDIVANRGYICYALWLHEEYSDVDGKNYEIKAEFCVNAASLARKEGAI